MKKDILKSIRDIALCLQSMVKSRWNKNIKIIFTKGRYQSCYFSFYKNYVWQFYVEDRTSYYMIYLLKNERVIKKDMIRKEEPVDRFYLRMSHFFHLI